jgi:hypothetical protein
MPIRIAEIDMIADVSILDCPRYFYPVASGSLYQSNAIVGAAQRQVSRACQYDVAGAVL